MDLHPLFEPDPCRCVVAQMPGQYSGSVQSRSTQAVLRWVCFQSLLQPAQPLLPVPSQVPEPVEPGAQLERSLSCGKILQYHSEVVMFSLQKVQPVGTAVSQPV